MVVLRRISCFLVVLLIHRLKFVHATQRTGELLSTASIEIDWSREIYFCQRQLLLLSFHLSSPRSSWSNHVPNIPRLIKTTNRKYKNIVTELTTNTQKQDAWNLIWNRIRFMIEIKNVCPVSVSRVSTLINAINSNCLLLKIRVSR